MSSINRRTFIKKSAVASAGVVVGAPAIRSFSARKNSAADTLNVAVIGVHGRGIEHYTQLSKIPNVKIAVLCDCVETLLPKAVAEVEKLTGYKPATETEFRKVLDNKDIHAVTIATPNHWHALMTIWACQAGKDVYVEKPVSHTLLEGRKMVEAARKYSRVVQAGTQGRSSIPTNKAIDFINSGGLGEVFMTKGTCYKPRASIGHTPDGKVPAGVNWDAFLGPAPYRPFNENRFLYKWHWFWDTGNGDIGNQSPHQFDIARWALGKRTHPVKIQSTGRFFLWDSDQETFNTQQAVYEYADGKVLEFEVRGLASNADGDMRIGNLVYGSKGWMSINNEDEGISKVTNADIQMTPSGFSSYKESPGPDFKNDDPSTSDPVLNHFRNFIDCVRSRKWQDLHADIEEGHISTSLSHLANIAARVKRTLYFNPENEKFVNDPDADAYLTRIYRSPYILPDNV